MIDVSEVRVEKSLGNYMVWDGDTIINGGNTPQDKAFYNNVKLVLAENNSYTQPLFGE